jgi:hypothetical protein
VIWSLLSMEAARSEGFQIHGGWQTLEGPGAAGKAFAQDMSRGCLGKGPLGWRAGAFLSFRMHGRRWETATVAPAIGGKEGALRAEGDGPTGFSNSGVDSPPGRLGWSGPSMRGTFVSGHEQCGGVPRACW